MKKDKPKFNVLNFGHRKRVKSRWRKPRGTHNKKRLKMAWTGAHPNIGYKNPDVVRGLHPSGYPEVRVFRPQDLDGLSNVVIRVASSVGARKRKAIEAKAKELGLKVLNPCRRCKE